MRYALIGVEGSHDQAFVGKVLKLLGCQSFDGNEANLDPFWINFVPSYPKQGNLYKRLDMPSILFTESVSVAIYSGEGSKLVRNLKANFANYPEYRTDIAAFGIVADADRKSPEQVALDYYNGFSNLFPGFPDRAGVVDTGSPRTGIYLLPDNVSQGVLDTLLCNCGEVAYPMYVERANSYLAQFSSEERKSLKWKPFDREKALIATIVSVLKPGKTNTVSLADNNWVSESTNMQVPTLASFVDFLRELLELHE
ncbi:MAG: hypothetical protein GDA43_06075 [Hormoscilla sp. SP5CHS1]|nr:hypothetical protein [Hormoscilla sp. SP5CHS1]